MHAHTTAAMAVSFDIVRASLQDLWKLDKAQCNQMLQSYNGTVAATSTEPMTVRALVFTVVLMMLLAFTLLCSGLVRMSVGLGRKTLNLEPVVRTLLRITFVLFLPVLSSVFSLTKAQGGAGFLLTLLWFLLVELIRMKVQVMVLPADGSSFSRSARRFTLMDNADEVGHMVWAGYLVFFNMGGRTHGEADKKWADAMKAMFAILWLLSFLKLMQRIFNTWVESRSWHTGRNPLLIAAYMQHVNEEAPPAVTSASHPDAVMEMCPFVVEGEHRLVFDNKKKKNKTMAMTTSGAEAQCKVVTTVDYGYGVGRCPSGQNDLKHVSLHLDLAEVDYKKSKLVTVGKVWQWRKEKGDIGRLFSGKRGLYFEDLCLSFSLFKLLRRRFEQYPMVEVGSDMARRVMLYGLLKLQGAGSANRPFRVLQLELNFLQHYYQAADRTVMSPRLLFIPNILLSTLFVPIYLIAILAILVSTKDADYFYCMAMVSSGARLENFPFLSFFLTLALLATLICFEAYEFFTSYLNFNWNLFRLVCFYNTLPAEDVYWLSRKLLYYMFVARYWIFSMTDKFLYRHGAYTAIQIRQASIVDAYGPIIHKFSAWTKRPTIPLATKAKTDIIKAMELIINGMENNLIVSLPPWVSGPCNDDKETKSATEVILASHLATELFNIKHEEKTLPGNNARVVATTLSRYCMYLVAHMPELLPDDEVWVSERFQEMRTCLANVLPTSYSCSMACMLCMSGWCCNFKDAMLPSLRRERHRLDKTTHHAMELLDKIEGWDQLAKFWVHLLIYLAPSNDVQGHAKAVATLGGDLISCLWAFCTHAGITRAHHHHPSV